MACAASKKPASAMMRVFCWAAIGAKPECKASSPSSRSWV